MRFIVDPPLPILLACILVLLLILSRRLRKENFLLLAVSTALSLGLAEGTCRYFGIGNPMRPSWREDRLYGELFAYAPNGKLRYQYPDNPRGYFDGRNEVHGAINSQGFRGSEVELEKSGEGLRVAFLGDSFTLGIGVKDADTFPERFREAFLKRHNSVEVLNFGVSGSSTSEQIELLERLVVNFSPDVVVVVMFLNDADRTGSTEFFTGALLLTRLRNHSYFANALIGVMERTILTRRMISHYREGYVDGAPGWENVKIALRRAKVLSEGSDFRLVIAVYPVLFRLDGIYPFADIHDEVQRFCQNEGLKFVDLLPAFKGSTDAQLWVHPMDQHPNEVANSKAGNELAEFFETEILPVK